MYILLKFGLYLIEHIAYIGSSRRKLFLKCVSFIIDIGHSIYCRALNKCGMFYTIYTLYILTGFGEKSFQSSKIYHLKYFN